MPLGMVETTLAIAGTSTLVVASVYGYVGLRLSRQARGAGPGQRAMRLFSLWWIATAVNQSLGGLFYVAYAFGSSDVSLQLTYVFVQRLLLAISLVGLMGYLLYLQTGREHLRTLVVVYALYFASAVYTLTARTAIGIESYGWRTDLVWDRTLPRIWDLTALVIAVPPTIGALAMLRVYRRVEGPTRRFRIAMIGIGFVVWWVLAIVAGNPATFELGWLQALNRLVGLTVAVGILLAYEPMGWMRRRYQLEPFSSQG